MGFLQQAVGDLDIFDILNEIDAYTINSELNNLDSFQIHLLNLLLIFELYFVPSHTLFVY